MENKIKYLQAALPIIKTHVLDREDQYDFKEQEVLKSATLACDLHDLYSIRDAVNELDFYFENQISKLKNEKENLEMIFQNIDTVFNSILALENEIPALAELRTIKKPEVTIQAVYDDLHCLVDVFTTEGSAYRFIDDQYPHYKVILNTAGKYNANGYSLEVTIHSLQNNALVDRFHIKPMTVK